MEGFHEAISFLPMEIDLPAAEDSLPVPKNQTNPLCSMSKVTLYVEETFLSIVDEIQKRPVGQPKIALRRITSLKPSFDHSQMQLQWHVEDREVVYYFAGKNKDEAWRFTCVGKILSEIYGAIKSGVTVTKRDIYYQDPELFRRQATVDRYIDDIAHTCQVTRADLHVTASPKGLVAGLYPLASGTSDKSELIPDSLAEVEKMSLAHVKWIVVIEKEATLKALVENGLHRCESIGNGLLVTGKGYPDLATRRFLRSCLDHKSLQRSVPPIFGLFDCDPDGINILKTYRYGSKALAQEHSYNIPEMHWLGMKLSDEFLSGADDKAVIALTPRDRTRAVSMLGNEDWEGVPGKSLLGSDGCREALQHMLMLNRKMEIQILEERSEGTSAWLKEKLEEAMKAR